MSPSKKQYEYTSLLTLKESKQPMKGVHVIAVIKFFREPMKTRGTSYSMTVGLTDPSLAGGKLICSIFNDSIDGLPKVSCFATFQLFLALGANDKCNNQYHLALLLFRSLLRAMC